MGYKIDKTLFDSENPMKENQISDVLRENEEIFWEEKPQKKSYIWGRILPMLPIALIWILFDGVFIFLLLNFGVFNELPPIATVGIVVFFLFHLAPVWIWISHIISGFVGYKNIHYCLTNQRLIVRSGIIPDIASYEYTSLTNVYCKVGLVDRILRVGDLYISALNQKVVLHDIKNPYKISSIIQKIIIDIKTDIHYPNKLRPEENPGYNTKLK